MLVFYSLVLLVLFLWTKYQWTNRRLLRAASSVPPIMNTHPLIGNLYALRHGIEAFTSLALKSLVKSMERGVNTVCFWAGGFPFIIIMGQKDIQKALTSSKSSEKSYEYKFAEFALGNGLLTAPGHVWKIKRRSTSQMFHQSNLDGMMPTFNRISRDLVLELSKQVGKGPFNILHNAVLFSLVSLSNFVFGIDLEFTCHAEDIRALEQKIGRITDLVTKQTTFFWLRFQPLFNFVYRQDVKEVQSVIRNLIVNSKKMKEANKGRDDTCDTSSKKPITYHEAIANQNKEHPELCSDWSVQSDIITMYIAGSDTSAVTVSSCMLALGKHKDVQSQLVEEIEAVMGAREEVTVEDLQKMTYLEQVYQESLRWSAVLPLVQRKATEDLELGDVTIPAGSSFLLSLGSLSHNPEVFPDPNRFNPENFSAEKRSSRPPGSFLPFSGGPRNCIGKRYADLSLKIMILYIVRHYEVSTEMDIDNLKRKISVVLVNTEGYLVSLAKRVRANV